MPAARERTSFRCRTAVLAILVSLLGAAAAAGQEIRVLMVGDSWADFMWQDRSLRDVFAEEGRGDLEEKGDLTAISGSTAAEWIAPAMLQLITDELTNNPTIDTVQLTIGGNDFLAGMPGGGWYVGMPTVDQQALFDRIEADTLTVIDHILAHDPDIEVVLSLYDYTNFVDSLSGLLFFICVPTYNDLNMPTPLEVNTVALALEERMSGVVAALPRTHMVRHSGLMQFTYGFPSMSIPPGTLLPPGDLSLPSPAAAMRFFGDDCFHLSGDGHLEVARNLWRGYYRQRFSRIFADGFENGDTAAWSATLP